MASGKCEMAQCLHIVPLSLRPAAATGYRQHEVLVILCKVHLPAEGTLAAVAAEPCAGAVLLRRRPVPDLGGLGVDHLELLAAVRAVDEQSAISALGVDLGRSAGQAPGVRSFLKELLVLVLVVGVVLLGTGALDGGSLCVSLVPARHSGILLGGAVALFRVGMHPYNK